MTDESYRSKFRVQSSKFKVLGPRTEKQPSASSAQTDARVGAVPNDGGLSSMGNREAAGFDHQFVDGTVGGRGDDPFGVDFRKKTAAFGRTGLPPKSRDRRD